MPSRSWKLFADRRILLHNFYTLGLFQYLAGAGWASWRGRKGNTRRRCTAPACPSPSCTRLPGRCNILSCRPCRRRRRYRRLDHVGGHCGTVLVGLDLEADGVLQRGMGILNLGHTRWGRRKELAVYLAHSLFPGRRALESVGRRCRSAAPGPPPEWPDRGTSPCPFHWCQSSHGRPCLARPAWRPPSE